MPTWAAAVGLVDQRRHGVLDGSRGGFPQMTLGFEVTAQGWLAAHRSNQKVNISITLVIAGGLGIHVLFRDIGRDKGQRECHPIRCLFTRKAIGFPLAERLSSATA